jgi:hypothetical protein
VKILGYEFQLERKESTSDLGAMGWYKGRVQKIQIATDMHPEQELSTILHEIIEALNYHLSLGIEHKSIMALEAGLYQCLIDNGVDLTPLRKEIQE